MTNDAKPRKKVIQGYINADPAMVGNHVISLVGFINEPSKGEEANCELDYARGKKDRIVDPKRVIVRATKAINPGDELLTCYTGEKQHKEYKRDYETACVDEKTAGYKRRKYKHPIV